MRTCTHAMHAPRAPHVSGAAGPSTATVPLLPRAAPGYDQASIVSGNVPSNAVPSGLAPLARHCAGRRPPSRPCGLLPSALSSAVTGCVPAVGGGAQPSCAPPRPHRALLHWPTPSCRRLCLGAAPAFGGARCNALAASQGPDGRRTANPPAPPAIRLCQPTSGQKPNLPFVRGGCTRTLSPSCRVGRPLPLRSGPRPRHAHPFVDSASARQAPDARQGTRERVRSGPVPLNAWAPVQSELRRCLHSTSARRAVPDRRRPPCAPPTPNVARALPDRLLVLICMHCDRSKSAAFARSADGRALHQAHSPWPCSN
jgi:hypothetical protein